MESVKQEAVKPQEGELDERGVPLVNKVRELERKMQDKYERELADTRRELQEMKASLDAQEQAPPTPQAQSFTGANLEEQSKAELMEFVKNPKGYFQARLQEQETQRQQAEWQRQVPEAESWIKGQKGYTGDDDARVYQIIKENKLDTPFHTPMERAKIAWKFLSSEKRDKEFSAMTEDQRREASISKNSVEGGGKTTPKTTGPNRADLIKKLAIAEQKGDLDAAIRITSLLEDVRE